MPENSSGVLEEGGPVRVGPGTLRVPTRVWNDNDVDQDYEGLVDDGSLQVLEMSVMSSSVG